MRIVVVHWYRRSGIARASTFPARHYVFNECECRGRSLISVLSVPEAASGDRHLDKRVLDYCSLLLAATARMGNVRMRAGYIYR